MKPHHVERAWDAANGLLWAVVISLLAGCEAFEQPYKQPPQVSQVVVTVVWTDADEIRKRCSSQQAYACATVPPCAGAFAHSTIYAIKPRSFSHAPLVEALGHELLHSLCATHE